MSTVTHPDGIKTAIDTSKFQGKARLSFLRRCGMSDQQVDALATQWQKDEQQAHADEHQRVLEMVRFLRDDCAAPDRAAMYLAQYTA